MKLYNTLTRQKEEFIPLEEGKVKMYSCGPTVYNFFHIGNARPFIMFDVLRRYLEYLGYDVKFVQNFTDVDDKIIQRANEEGISPFEVGQKYIDEYFIDADGLGIKRADVYPRVTETIDDIIEFVKGLIEKGYAYEVNGDVYYDSHKFGDYGKLSGQNLDELEIGARIDINENKRHPADFVLWKAKKEGEPGWMSPWGEGRPGWHIECSVMSKKHLGETIDIHSGGQDLIFPHHENEIAQSEAFSGKPFAKYWVHNGYININNEKMSKSKGNFFTVRDISNQIDLEIVRFFMLSAHYRSPINYSEELLMQAKAGLERLYNTKEKLQFMIQNATLDASPADSELIAELEGFKERFKQNMDDDLNTADAISVIFELSRFINTKLDEAVSREFMEKSMELFKELTGVLNIVCKDSQDELLDEEIESLIQERLDARKNKDFKRSDEIRDLLKEKGIVLEDTRQGTKWKRA
ncbi:cysteinyl-tRNA synthetase CysS [Peptoclostridium acidaminophilum DSM 3953]|uniref:Cysteine--tRNA ligase n=1 Tax=Peptoclostridium acidaminophilum DSM 3953 TaxID=1286171 RepID=W8T160_PEPAC|nr:cysteine--tRNA ligase [Peptoclostridium acidaminophilum]AHM55469.1 cysteinyl-tRNA synthetase CysS [Peptoclostridium acidaminophilum DSM 3953]